MPKPVIAGSVIFCHPNSAHVSIEPEAIPPAFPNPMMLLICFCVCYKDQLVIDHEACYTFLQAYNMHMDKLHLQTQTFSIHSFLLSCGRMDYSYSLFQLQTENVIHAHWSLPHVQGQSWYQELHYIVY